MGFFQVADTYVVGLHVAPLSNKPDDVIFQLIVENDVGQSGFEITLQKLMDEHNNSLSETFNVLIIPGLILISIFLLS